MEISSKVFTSEFFFFFSDDESLKMSKEWRKKVKEWKEDRTIICAKDEEVEYKR
jgi:hypothetical protein